MTHSTTPIHGTRRSYNHGCRCVECRLANTEHRRETRAEPAGRFCLICGMTLIDHPMKACWRWAAGR